MRNPILAHRVPGQECENQPKGQLVAVVDQIHPSGLDQGEDAVLQASEIHGGCGARILASQPIG